MIDLSNLIVFPEFILNAECGRMCVSFRDMIKLYNGITGAQVFNLWEIEKIKEILRLYGSGFLEE